MDTILGAIDAQGFSIFMIGWLIALTGGVVHLIGGGFKDGASKVPVLGNWQALKEGEKGFVQQFVGAWIFRIGALMVVVGGIIHFS